MLQFILLENLSRGCGYQHKSDLKGDYLKADINGDEKYTKRSKQEKSKRLQFLLIGCSIIFLASAYYFLNEKGISKKRIVLPSSYGGGFSSAIQQHLQKLEEHMLNSGKLPHGEYQFDPEAITKLLTSLRVEDESLHVRENNNISSPIFLAKRHETTKMRWEIESETVNLDAGPKLDYNQHLYEYPEIPATNVPPRSGYPQLRKFGDVLSEWPQGEIDSPPTPFKETMIHFDYTNPHDIKMAEQYEKAKLPFKLINVPEVVAAGQKWTDDFLTKHFHIMQGQSRGRVREAPTSFFLFTVYQNWPTDALGLPPTRANTWDYSTFSKHARYADAAGIGPDQPHFYYEGVIDQMLRKDLSLFEDHQSILSFHRKYPGEIVCRFGERGIVGALHWDPIRNMLAVLSGARRIILSPPSECSKYSILPMENSALARHSPINFAKRDFLDTSSTISDQERELLARADEGMVVETVLKAGEVLYLPPHWMHYIIQLQKNIQCNAFTTADSIPHPIFGGREEVTKKCHAF